MSLRRRSSGFKKGWDNSPPARGSGGSPKGLDTKPVVEMEIGYRKDIQMLRGMAVLLVVLFHLEIPGFSSGFLGVDVFFVISGYLMAALYDPSRKAEFFAKRARRLLPAYFAAVLVTVIAATFITTPNDFRQVSNQALFSTIFASNIGFWMENSYFDKTAFKPLLHLWSLGVEIQFYLLLPVFHWLFRKLRIAFALMLIGSAMACFVVVGVSPKSSFFWLPFRLWEFLIGYGVCIWRYRQPGAGDGQTAWLGLAGLVVIAAIPSMKIDGGQPGFLVGHPGLLATLICLATAATLAFGIPRKMTANLVASALERIGDWSYSIYLTHFPLIVLALYQPFVGTVLKSGSAAQTGALALSIVALSALLYRFVEQPFHRSKRALRWTLVSAAAVLASSQAGILVQDAMLPERERLIYYAWFDRAEYRCGKINRILHPRAISCEVTEPVQTPVRRVLLVGNSHADSIKQAFAEAAQAAGVSVFFMVENNPLMAGGVTAKELIREAQARRADAIVLHYSPYGVDMSVVEELADLVAEHRMRLSYIMPVPTWSEHIPRALWRNLKEGGTVPSQNIADYRKANGRLASELDRIGLERIWTYSVAEAFCSEDCLLVSEEGKPLYFDGHHLTLTGSRRLRGVFDRVIMDLFS